jgi:hypothetical protein
VYGEFAVVAIYSGSRADLTYRAELGPSGGEYCANVFYRLEIPRKTEPRFREEDRTGYVCPVIVCGGFQWLTRRGVAGGVEVAGFAGGTEYTVVFLR